APPKPALKAKPPLPLLRRQSGASSVHIVRDRLPGDNLKPLERGDDRKCRLADALRDDRRILDDHLLAWRDFEEHLALTHDGALAALDADLVDPPSERGVHLTEHLHDLEDVERIALIELAAHRHERWRTRRLLCVEHAAGLRDNLIVLHHRGRDEDATHPLEELTIFETLGDLTGEVFVHAKLVEARARSEDREEAEELHPKLEARVRCADLAPLRRLEAPLRRARAKESVELMEGHRAGP